MPGATHGTLDQQVARTLQGSWLSMFATELFQGVGQIALFLLLLEAIWDWDVIFSKPDVYALFSLALGQSAWLALRRHHGLVNPWWTRLTGLVLYAVVETLIEGPAFFEKPKHLTFIVLTLMFVWGLVLEADKDKPRRAMLGTVLARAAQGIAPLFFYIALDLRDQPWLEGVDDFFKSAPHAFLLALAITQIGALIALTLIARRQREVIGKLLDQLKTLSLWGFGSHVVEQVLRERGPHGASRVDRAIGFIDVRGFTAWSEAHPPEDVIEMLNRFYAAVLNACGATGNRTAAALGWGGAVDWTDHLVGQPIRRAHQHPSQGKTIAYCRCPLSGASPRPPINAATHPGGGRALKHAADGRCTHLR